MTKKKSNSSNGSKVQRTKTKSTSRRTKERSFYGTIQSGNGDYHAIPKVYFVVSIFAVLASVGWKLMLVRKDDQTLTITRNENNVNMDSPLQGLVQLACQNSNCNADNVNVHGRSLLSGRRLEKGSSLLEISQDMQIWTLDALRDDFVKTNLVGARHINTNNFLVEQAFLAAYLAMLIKRNNSKKNPLDIDRTHTNPSVYLENLPTYDDYRSHHPVTFDLAELESLYGSHTQVYFLVSKRKEEIESEYNAFIRASNEFGSFIKYEDYVAARLNVQTRAFEAGVWNTEDVSPEELKLYRTKFGVDTNKEITAMVPILDSFNSHSRQQNVNYEYDPESKKFSVFASKTIKKGAELHDRLADRADLFPTYGLVHGDFSERTSTLLGGHHIVDVRVASAKRHLSTQKHEIVPYLQQDDGYKECVTEDDFNAMEFKRLKQKALLSIVNRYRNWIVSFPALDRTTNSRGQMHISIDTGVEQIISTGRLLALAHHDYHGDAYNVLKAAVDTLERSNDDEPLSLERGNDGLEYRALVWVWRLATHGVHQYCGAYEEWTCSAAERSDLDSFSKNSKKWYAAYVRHQEITALESLKEYAEHSYLEYTKTEDYNPESEEFFYRSTLCPVDSPGLKQLIYG